MDNESQDRSAEVHTYQCSRCQGFFDDQGSASVQCPYCAMLCDRANCLVTPPPVNPL